MVTFNDVGDSTKSHMVRPLAQKQAIDAQSPGELRRTQGEKESLVTKLDWEFAGKKDIDMPFGVGKEEQTGPGHHLDEPDDFERLENSFDGERGGHLLGRGSDKSPPYLIVSHLAII